jgi:hypothetical protein
MNPPKTLHQNVFFKLRSIYDQIIGNFEIDCYKELPSNLRVGWLDWFKRTKLIKNLDSFQLVETELRPNDKSFHFIKFILILNVIRYGIHIFLPEDEQILRYAGDLYQYYGGKRHLLIVPLFFTHFHLFNSYSTFITFLWIN